MSQQFSPDKGLPPTRFRPSAGQVGADSAQRALKPPPSGSKSKGRGSGGSSRQSSGGGTSLGLPPSPQGQDDALPVVERLLQYMASRQIGRGQPFGIWANRSGHHIGMSPGTQPYDVFSDFPKGY